MDITVNRALLAERLGHVAKAASGRIIETTECVLIEVGDKMSIMCTDNHFSIKSEFEAIVRIGGTVAAPANKLLEIVKRLDGDEIHFKLKGSKLEIKSNSSKLEIAIQEHDHFPKPNFISADFISLERVDFDFLASVKYCVSKEMKDGPLVGVVFRFNGNIISSIATDRKKLSKADIELDHEYGIHEYVIPVEILDSIMKSKSKKIDVSFLGNQACMKDELYQYTTLLLNDKYPPLTHLLSTQSSISVRTNIPKLIQSLEVAELATTKQKIIKMHIANNELKISAGAESLAFEEILQAEVEGPEVIVATNCKYLIDALRSAGTDTILRFTDKMKPIFIEGDTFNIVLPYLVRE